MPNKYTIVFDYVWIDGNGELRSKKRTMISNNEAKKWMDVPT